MNRSFERADLSPLRGRWTELVTVKPRHYEMLYDLSTTPEGMVRWRFRGRTPTMDQFVSTLSQGVLAQFVVNDLSDGAPKGLVVAYNGDDRNGIAYLGAQFASVAHGQRGLRLESVALLINHVLTYWPFRKLYIEAAEYNVPSWQSAIGRYFVEEGRLRDHLYFCDRFWDLVTFTIEREDAAALVHRLLPYLDRPVGGAEHGSSQATR